MQSNLKFHEILRLIFRNTYFSWGKKLASSLHQSMPKWVLWKPETSRFHQLQGLEFLQMALLSCLRVYSKINLFLTTIQYRVCVQCMGSFLVSCRWKNAMDRSWGNARWSCPLEGKANHRHQGYFHYFTKCFNKVVFLSYTTHCRVIWHWEDLHG